MKLSTYFKHLNYFSICVTVLRIFETEVFLFGCHQENWKYQVPEVKVYITILRLTRTTRNLTQH